MFETLNLAALAMVGSKVAEESAKKDPEILQVVVVGIGTVFIGLIAIVLICKIVGLFCKTAKGDGDASKPVAQKTAAPVVNAPIENKGEIVAAVCAVVAEELGTDVSALRVRSFKKL